MGGVLLESISITDKGLTRRSNQDFVYISEEPVGKLPNLFIVADGMGGHRAGDYASNYSVNTFVDYVRESQCELPVSIICEAIKATNTSVVKTASNNEELKGMGTTFVVATIQDLNLIVANIGDSRLYVIDDNIRQITKDHSLVEEMVEEGKINRDNARIHPKKNIITRAIGVQNKIIPDVFEVELQKGNIILMCSDGLSNMLDDDEIMNIVKDNLDRLDLVAQILVDKANECGGLDNISVVIVKL